MNCGVWDAGETIRAARIDVYVGGRIAVKCGCLDTKTEKMGNGLMDR